MTQLALRLSSFRDLLVKDLEGTLDRIAQAGFRSVEVTEVLGQSNEQFGEALERAGLHVVSLHTQLHHLRARFVENVNLDRLLKSEYLVIPIVQLDEYGSGWERLGAEVGRIGQLVAMHGLRLAYQPTQAEFRPDRGRTGLDFFAESAGDAVDYELDLKAMLDAKADPRAWCDKLGERVSLVVLDMGDREPIDADPVLAEWRGLSPCMNQYGVKWTVVNEMPGAGDRFQKLSEILSATSRASVSP